jgi:hypothetical protein
MSDTFVAWLHDAFVASACSWSSRHRPIAAWVLLGPRTLNRFRLLSDWRDDVRSCTRLDHMIRPLTIALSAVVAMTLLVTWPQGAHMTTAFASHADSYFSTWRLMWISHALQVSPHALFDANIFHPETKTLAFSDATMLQGALAAPFLWMGASPILVYNLMLLTGFVASGLAMFLLAWHLTGRTAPALIAAAAFTMAPYRIEHFMHLELQWAMWIPLTFWALHRTVADRSWRFGVLAGLFVWLQCMSCIYYGIFLAVATLILVPLLMATTGRMSLGAIPGLALGALLAGLLTLPYALPYMQNASVLGERGPWEVMQFSATPINYLATTADNRVWGWTAPLFGADERRLFPGALAVILAACALFLQPRRRDVWIYLAIAIVAIELSFGLNGHVYPWLSRYVNVLSGLRSPARFAIVAQSAIAVLAAIGFSALQDRLAGRARIRVALPAVALLLMAIELSNEPMTLSRVSAPTRASTDVYRVVRTLGPGVVLELPMPTMTTLPGDEPKYAFWSAAHWNKLVNGYSGYYPRGYAQTIYRMERFPDPDSLALLKQMEVRYVVIHREFYAEEGRYAEVLLRMAAEPSLTSVGTFRDPVGEARLFVVNDNRAPGLSQSMSGNAP